MKNLLDFLFYNVLGDEYGNEGIGRVAQLASLTENISFRAGGGYSRGGTATGTYAYDKNWNMTNDSRRALISVIMS